MELIQIKSEIKDFLQSFQEHMQEAETATEGNRDKLMNTCVDRMVMCLQSLENLTDQFRTNSENLIENRKEFVNDLFV